MANKQKKEWKMSEKLDKKTRKLVNVVLGATSPELRPLVKQKLRLIVRNMMLHVEEDMADITIANIGPDGYAKQLGKRVIK